MLIIIDRNLDGTRFEEYDSWEICCLVSG
jgi:hypothetical protein